MAKAAIQPKHSYKGREYTFVDTSARVLEEFKCGICLNLVEDPVSTTCEHFFCRECIENQLTCPMCRRSFKVTSDRRSEKILMALSVKCPLTEKGCEWEGELGNVADHFEKACEYNEVDCPKGCGKVLKGPRDTVNKHLTYCGDFPLPCPAGCRSTRKRKEMKQHLSSECLEEVVSCKYALFGCNKTTKRRKIENHTSDDSFHFKKSMDAQPAIFNCHIKGFQSQSYQKPDLSVLPLSFRPWLVNNPTCYPCPPWVIRIKELKSSQRSRFESYHSTPVYSHYGGYKMEIRTTLTLLSVTFIFISFYLMKGENDKGLRFPFEGKIVVSLLNQLEDANHLRKEVHGTAGKEAGLQNIGSVLYIDSDDIGLNDSAKNCQYLKMIASFSELMNSMLTLIRNTIVD